MYIIISYLLLYIMFAFDINILLEEETQNNPFYNDYKDRGNSFIQSKQLTRMKKIIASKKKQSFLSEVMKDIESNNSKKSDKSDKSSENNFETTIRKLRLKRKK